MKLWVIVVVVARYGLYEAGFIGLVSSFLVHSYLTLSIDQVGLGE